MKKINSLCALSLFATIISFTCFGGGVDNKLFKRVRDSVCHIRSAQLLQNFEPINTVPEYTRSFGSAAVNRDLIHRLESEIESDRRARDNDNNVRQATASSDEVSLHEATSESYYIVPGCLTPGPSNKGAVLERWFSQHEFPRPHMILFEGSNTPHIYYAPSVSPHKSTPPALDPETLADLDNKAYVSACSICFASAQKLTDKHIALATTTCCKQALCSSCIKTIIARMNNCPFCRAKPLEYTEENTNKSAEVSSSHAEG